MTSLFRHQHPRYTRPGAFVGLLLMLAFALGLSACSGNGSISTDNGTGTTTAGDTATATTASLTPTVVAATTPVPTATTHPGGGAPTATPIPVLQGQVVTQGLGSIGANTNSSIVDVACPSGYLVAGGGIASGYANFTTMESAPISTTTWRAEIYNQNGSAISAQVQVMCIKAPGLTGQVVTQGLGSIGANTNSSIVDVACPSGFLVAGGGVSSGYANFTTMESAPISTTKFRAEIYNQNSSAISAQVQVMCLKVAALQGQVVVQGLGSIGANTNSSIVDVACPSGFLNAGGGIASGYANFTTMETAPISTTKFRAEIYNQNSSAISAQVQVSCLKLG